MHRPHRVAILLVAGLLAIVAVAGCSRSLLTAPDPATSRTTTEIVQPEAPPPPSGRLAGPSILATGITLPPVLPVLKSAWRTLTATLVRVGEVKTVSGGRYSLDFQSGSLSEDAVITIQDYDSDILDVELGPSGTRFGDPVRLSIDFTGTAADPGSDWYDHREPAVFWLNETTNQWEEVPSTTDWEHKRIEVQLHHFSRYVVGGKAGWKGQPNRADD